MCKLKDNFLSQLKNSNLERKLLYKILEKVIVALGY